MDKCIVCNRPVKWHFAAGRKLSCGELEIQITGVLPRYSACTDRELWRDVARFERERERRCRAT